MTHSANLRAGAGGIALALAAGAMWGSLGLITHELLRFGLSAAQLAMLRLGGAFAITALIAFALRRYRRLTARQWGLLALIGLFCQALSSVSFSASVAGAGSSLAIVLLCMGPLFTAAINRVVFGDRRRAPRSVGGDRSRLR
ncbi:MAG: EamA family transporter [Lysobacter sp.]